MVLERISDNCSEYLNFCLYLSLCGELTFANILEMKIDANWVEIFNISKPDFFSNIHWLMSPSLFLSNSSLKCCINFERFYVWQLEVLGTLNKANKVRNKCIIIICLCKTRDHSSFLITGICWYILRIG